MRRRQTYIYIALAVLLIGGGVALFGGPYFRWYSAPYNTAGKTIAWTVGMPEPAYNFDTVVTGRLYRSGLPDARFLDYMRRRYGIQHVVSLAGASEIHARAKELGMNVTVLDWRKAEPPATQISRCFSRYSMGTNACWCIARPAETGADMRSRSIGYAGSIGHSSARSRKWKHTVIHGGIVWKPTGCFANHSEN